MIAYLPKLSPPFASHEILRRTNPEGQSMAGKDTTRRRVCLNPTLVAINFNEPGVEALGELSGSCSCVVCLNQEITK